MSYDLMVFKKEAAPKQRADFMEWYDHQTEWTEDHDYNDPKNTALELNNWYVEMIQTFPNMNGEDREDLDDDDFDDAYESDYSIGKDVIYVAFAWSIAEEAYNKMYELAAKHGVGFFDVSSNEGAILFPENGNLVPIDTKG
ncbi:hypothetical protein ACKUSY_00090 [Myroides odoratus]